MPQGAAEVARKPYRLVRRVNRAIGERVGATEGGVAEASADIASAKTAQRHVPRG
jgi:hypothetical protein